MRTFQLPLSGSHKRHHRPHHRLHPLSTPSLGITRDSHLTSRPWLTSSFQLPLSGSLSRSESRARRIAWRSFQLPLSGSLAYQLVTRQKDWRFQLPLSGSRPRSARAPRRGGGGRLSTPSLGITLTKGVMWLQESRLSTPSLGITLRRRGRDQHETHEAQPFNSLSRDDSRASCDDARTRIRFQLPLSGSHAGPRLSDPMRVIAELSTPSLGITCEAAC